MSCRSQDTFPRGELCLKLPLNGRRGASAAPAGRAISSHGVRGDARVSPLQPGSHPTQHPLWQSHFFVRASSGVSSVIGRASFCPFGDKVTCFCQLWELLVWGEKQNTRRLLFREEGRTPASEEHVEQEACSESSRLPSSPLNVSPVLWKTERSAYGNNQKRTREAPAPCALWPLAFLRLQEDRHQAEPEPPREKHCVDLVPDFSHL